MADLFEYGIPLASIVPLGTELSDGLALLQLVVKSFISSADGDGSKESSDSGKSEEAHS